MKTPKYTRILPAIISAGLLAGASPLLAGVKGSYQPMPPSTTKVSSGGGLIFGGYANLEAGVNIADPLKLSQPLGFLVTGQPVTGQISLNTGFRVSGMFGHAFRLSDKVSLGLELEVGVIYNSLKNVTISAPGVASVSTPAGDGNYVQVPIMVNAIINWEFAPKWVLFGGGGAGYDLVFFSSNLTPGTVGTDGQFAWQAIAGLRYCVSNRFNMGVAYKYLSVQPKGLQQQANHGVVADFMFGF